MEIRNCPGLLTGGHAGYSPRFLRKMFGGKRVSHLLPYYSPEADQEETTRFMLNRGRLSISGMQVKYSMVQEKNQLRLTEKGEQSTYILKPVPHGFRRVAMTPANEHLTMQIASQIYKIRAAVNGLVFFRNGEPAYLTRRFDVDAQGRKRSVEDFASLAGRTEENAGMNFKYNYSYEGIGELIKNHVGAWRVEIEKLYRLIVFNFLFSNGDAHLKNFSLMETDNGDYLLSPAYDLLDTRLHIEEEDFFALDDDLFKDGYWSDCRIMSAQHHPCREDFLEFGRRIGIPEKRTLKLLEPFLTRQPGVEELVDRSFLDAECKALYLSHYRERLAMLNKV